MKINVENVRCALLMTALGSEWSIINGSSSFDCDLELRITVDDNGSSDDHLLS